MVLSSTSSHNPALKSFTLTHLPLELVLHMINCEPWSAKTIVSLLATSRALYRWKEPVLKAHLKAQGIDYMQLKCQLGEALLPVTALYHCYHKSRVFYDQMASYDAVGKGYYIPPEAWQVRQWPDACLIHSNMLVVLLIIGNVTCFQDLAQKIHFSSFDITAILSQAILYESRLPFSVQSSVIKVIAWLFEEKGFVPDHSLLEKSIAYDCEALTQTLLKQYHHLRRVPGIVCTQAFVLSYCHPIPAKRSVWSDCLVQLELQLDVQIPVEKQIPFWDRLLTLMYDHAHYSVSYVDAVLPKFARYQSTRSKEIAMPVLGLISAAGDSPLLQPYVPRLTEQEYVNGNVALFMYAIAIGNEALVERLMRRIPVTFNLLANTVAIIASAQENKKTIRFNSQTIDELFCTLLKMGYVEYAHLLSLEDKQAFITNIIKSNLIKSGYFILSDETNDCFCSEEFGVRLFEAIQPFIQPNDKPRFQLLLHYFPSLLTNCDLIENVLSVGDDKTMSYLVATYPEQIPIYIADIVRMACDSRQLPIIQAIVKNKSVIFQHTEWTREFRILLEEDFFISTRDDNIKIDIARLEILHYFLDQALVESLPTVLQLVTREINTFHDGLQTIQDYMTMSNPQAAYLAYATLLLTLLDKAIEGRVVAQTEIESTIELIKRLVKGGSLFEILEDWLLKAHYPNVTKALLNIDITQFISIMCAVNMRSSVEFIAQDAKKLGALHTLIAHYDLQDAVLIPRLLDCVLRNHSQRTDWVQLLIKQRVKVERITSDEQALLKVNYGEFGEQWLQLHYSDQLGPSVIDALRVLRI